MIEFTKSYKTSDGQVFGTIEDAQVHELEILLDDDKFNATSHSLIAQFLVSKKDSFLDILTTTPNSKPKARAINGGTKKRVKKTVITDANTDANQTPTTADLTALAR